MSQDIRILLVDDFIMVRVMLKNTLSDLGYAHVDEAENGKQALSMINDMQTAGTPYSLIFCDWNMPEVTGIEVLEAFRANPAFKNTPFVMVTAEAEHEFVVRAIRAGASDYLVKPIAPDVLEAKVNKMIAKLKSSAAA